MKPLKAILLVAFGLSIYARSHACMVLVNVPTKHVVSNYSSFDSVLNNPPLVNISIEGEATLKLPKTDSSHRWRVKNLAQLSTDWLFEFKEIHLNGQYLTEMIWIHPFNKGDRYKQNQNAWETVKTIEMPLQLIYEIDDEVAYEITGTLKVSEGKVIGLTSHYNERLIIINHHRITSEAYFGRPFKIEWQDNTQAQKNWRLKVAEYVVKDADSSIERHQADVTLKKAADGSHTITGLASGNEIQMTLSADNEVDIQIVITVTPSPAC